ncbi:MAG: site-specific DNA-methyltransferase [Proteobacteria bacterium]|nr:site-specific DNA-methyltransferase [Pseudomonadota bacterium]MCP4920464.1 site-specific DNA-methyltransferase [Pseudomonadota bacterium]
MLDPCANHLIHGSAIPTLAALEAQFAGTVRCAWIDPPYNTGNTAGRGQQYDDARDRAAWLEMMRQTCSGLRDLLRPDGSLFVQIDDNEMDRLRLMLDEVFGPDAFIARITVDARAPSQFSTVNRGLFKSSEYLLWYAKDRSRFRWNPLRVARAPDRAYSMWLENPQDAVTDWTFCPLGSVARGEEADRLRVQQSARMFRLASISDTKAGKAIRALKATSKASPDRVFVVPRDGLDDQWVLRGQQLICYDRQVSVIDGKRCASRPLTNVWTDIRWEGIANEGGVRFKFGKKPERLVRRCLQLATDPGDRVIDCFLGSGTTAAVAHKMGRTWLGVEEGDHVGLPVERLKRVIGGDPTGISKLTGWTGGGSFSLS